MAAAPNRNFHTHFPACSFPCCEISFDACSALYPKKPAHKIPSSTAPHHCIVPPPQAPHNTAMAASSKAHGTFNRFPNSAPGSKTIPVAKIMAVFAVTDPSAFPIAMSAFPRAAASTDTIISGKVVARLTTVAPTRKGGKPIPRARPPAASTKASPPLITSKIPSAKLIAPQKSSTFIAPFSQPVLIKYAGAIDSFRTIVYNRLKIRKGGFP